MKYRFEEIEVKTIKVKYTKLKIVDHEAEIDPDDAEQVALAKEYGGVPVEEEPKKTAIKAKRGGAAEKKIVDEVRKAIDDEAEAGK